jgi:hypothetical protein
MDRERAILDAMGRMYEAAADPAHLPEIGTALRDGLGVESGIMFVCEQATGRMLHLLQASGIFDETARRDYAAHYHAINPWFARPFSAGRRLRRAARNCWTPTPSPAANSRPTGVGASASTT